MKNQQNECTKQRLGSAWTAVQSDQSLLCAQLVTNDRSFLHGVSKTSDKTEMVLMLT